MVVGLPIAALPMADTAEKGQRVGFTDPVADLPGQGECLLKMLDGLRTAPLMLVDAAEGGQHADFTDPVADLAEQA